MCVCWWFLCVWLGGVVLGVGGFVGVCGWCGGVVWVKLIVNSLSFLKME